MATPLLNNTVVLQDESLLELAMQDYYNKIGHYKSGMLGGDVEKIVLDPDYALTVLRADPLFSARFMRLVSGSGGPRAGVVWNGALSEIEVDGGGALGARVFRRKEGWFYAGDNRFGKFLEDVYDRYAEELRETVPAEVPLKDGQVVADFTRKGEALSDIMLREENGQKFIHTDVYVPVRFRFDTARDGTTGHASRRTDEDVEFKKFDCPFGTSYPYPLRVDTAAEASFLYEKAIRGELDWEATLRDLEERGLIEKMTDRRRKSEAQQYRAQFLWMRDEICLNPEVRRLPIVAASMLVPDTSFGRSLYDPVYAPSPAHVLARYINNPVLLFQRSENGVLKALSIAAKHEQEGFDPDAAVKSVRMMVVASDTIGGRVPGSRATMKTVPEEVVTESGERIIREVQRPEFRYKSRDESEADYAAFSARLASLVDPLLDRGVSVELVTGNQSLMSDSIGTGGPRMVQRFVAERGGAVWGWNFSRGVREPLKAAGQEHEVTDDRLSVVVMEHFMDCYPVIVGDSPSVSFNLTRNDDTTRVSFNRESGLGADCGVCFSVAKDTAFRNTLTAGSYAVGAGLPLVHVQENRTLNDQRVALSSGAVLSQMALTGEVDVSRPVFGEGERTAWDMGEAANLSWRDPATGVFVPIVSNYYPAAVSVGSMSFHDAYSAYVALAAVAVGEGSRINLSRIIDAGGHTTRLHEIEERILQGKAFTPVMQEKALRQAVSLMMKANPAFSDRILATEGRDIVLPASTGDRVLFTDADGNGANRFAVVLASERDNVLALREARRVEEEERRRDLLKEANRKQAVGGKMKAEFEKVPGGVPRTMDEARESVWFMGTNRPEHLFLPPSERTFETWDEMNGKDNLVREKAGQATVSDGDGGEVPNTFHFMFPSDLEAVVGKRRVTNTANSRDLTGVTREDPNTGERYVCATGIPVRYNNKGNEYNNPEGLPCSFFKDNNSSRFRDYMIVAFSQAISEAHRHGNSLCMVQKKRRDGQPYYPLGYQFMDKVYSASKGGWVDNPNRSPINLETLNRAISILENGRNFPLTCITMPSRSYTTEDSPEAVERFREQLADVRSAENRDKGLVTPHYFSAEGRFVAELMLSLEIANATALFLGKPLRFPLDAEGHYELGPGVPKKFRDLAEKRIDAFIGVVREEDIAKGALPVLQTIPLHDWSRYDMVACGEMLKIPASDLVYAFGQYDFSHIFAGELHCPLHEMMFRLEDGPVFKLVDTATTSGKGPAEINPFLSYTNVGDTVFKIYASEPERTKEFLAVLQAYVERAKRVKVEAKLVREGEPGTQDYGMEGYVNLLSSNSEEFGSSFTVKVDRLTKKELAGVAYTYGTYGLNRIHTDESVPSLDGMAFRMGDAWGRLSDISVEGSRRFMMKISDIGATSACKDSILTFLRASKAALEQKPLKKGEGETDEAFAERQKARAAVFEGYDDLIKFVNGDFQRNFRVRETPSLHDEVTTFFEARRFDVETVRTLGREMNIYNLDNRFDGTDNSKVYYGKTDAGDGFAGWAMLRYLLPDGRQSDWFVVKDQELATDMVLTMVHRTYKFNDADLVDHVLPSARVMKILNVAEAVKHAGEDFRVMRDYVPQRKAEVDDKVVDIERPEVAAATAAVKDAAPEKERSFDAVNVWAGSRENVELSNFAEANVPWRTPDGKEVVFKSAEQCYQYMKTYFCEDDGGSMDARRKAILGMTNGRLLKEFASRLPLRVNEWDEVRDGLLLDIMRVSYDPALNPHRAKALLDTGDAVITHTQAGGHWAEVFPKHLMQIRDELNAKLSPVEKEGMAEDGRVFVSYYGSRNLPDDAVLVQISTSRPAGLEVEVEFESMYPNYRTMVAPHKDGTIDDQGYIDRYRKDVLEKNGDRIVEGVRSLQEEFRGSGRDIYLLCYEKPGDFCHRYLVADFLQEHGIDCRECPGDRLQYSEGRIPLAYEERLGVPERPAAAGPVLEPELPFAEPEAKPQVRFTESSGGYKVRTIENANADDIDFTFAFAANFGTAGEVLTRESSKDWYIGVDLPRAADGRGLDLSKEAIAAAGDRIYDLLPEEFRKGEPMSVNLAGNGIYTLAQYGITQEQVNEFICGVHEHLASKGVNVKFYRSGGQTGVDQAVGALNEVFGVPVTVHAPKGYVFRGADGKDVKDERLFKARFVPQMAETLKRKFRRGI